MKLVQMILFSYKCSRSLEEDEEKFGMDVWGEE